MTTINEQELKNLKTVKEYADKIGVSHQRVYKMITDGKEKELKITRLQDALTQKDSITLALVTSLKREVGINDPDIEVNVEKVVVFISIADKVLFQSGSYNVTTRAKEVLAKVAKVVNSKPDF